MPPLLQGLVIGVSIAAPVGPIGLLCIRRSLAEGRLAGFVSGLGAATADAVYGVIAALGLTALTQVLLAHQFWLRLGGGLFLLYLGLVTLRSKPPSEASRAEAPRRAAKIEAYLSVFLLTVTNPMTILAFLGIFAGLGAGQTGAAAAWLVLGVFLGSAAWWLLLSTAASSFSHRLSHGGLRLVNLISGLIIAAFGLWQLASLL